MSERFLYDASEAWRRIAATRPRAEFAASQTSQESRGHDRAHVRMDRRGDVACRGLHHQHVELAARAPCPAPSRMSQMSPDGSNEFPNRHGLSDDERDDFEERAAIIEYDGCIPRARAETIALEDVRDARAALAPPGE